MPVHSAGARLYKSVKFRHLVKKSGSAAGSRASNVSLNLTPFVDMMTVLVTFLLMVFSSTGQLLEAQKGLDLPLAKSRETLQQAPVIIVTKSEITYQGQLVATVESVLRDDSPTFKIDALFERLDAASKKIKEDIAMGRQPKDLIKACEEAKSNIRPAPGKICPDGLAILQADESTDARLINKIVNTAKAAGFDNLLFAVKNK
ncbi:MAG TPA: biopolymer transporter ExbD [Kofleriaceae bacterium]|jgi:biopolymer transport protein ExbD|nr:biopolymer transporter ExbD [Kofleriaceae bacterium]